MSDPLYLSRDDFREAVKQMYPLNKENLPQYIEFLRDIRTQFFHAIDTRSRLAKDSIDEELKNELNDTHMQFIEREQIKKPSIDRWYHDDDEDSQGATFQPEEHEGIQHFRMTPRRPKLEQLMTQNSLL